MEDVSRYAVECAQAAGATYADARYVRRQVERVETTNGVVEGLTAAESRGIGVRVIADGAWGFACNSQLDRDTVRRTAELAVRVAKASATTKKQDVALAPVEPYVDSTSTRYEKDPFDVPLEERIQLLLDCDQRMAQAAELAVREGYLSAFRETKHFASSEEASLSQERTETGAMISATAARGETQQRSYPGSHGGQVATRGWEMVEELDLPGHAEQIAQEAAALLDAPHCPEEELDIILQGGQLALQLHESCGHPIELDRVLGTEASYAGTSFLTPDKLGSFRYGSDEVNITADATLEGGLGSFAYDDEGVPAQRTQIVDHGIFCGYLSSRETAAQQGLPRGSSGAMRADGWSRIPLIRMTNINLQPGDWTLDEMIKETKHGLLLKVNTSWSIDDRRLNFQFGTEIGYVIQNGAIVGIMRNPTYTGITPQFWGSCDAVAGEDEWVIWGVPNCGKGEPGQSAHVGHGVSAARFRHVRVGVLRDLPPRPGVRRQA